MPWRRLEYVLKTCLEDILKTCLEEVLKTCLEDVLRTSWRHTKCLLVISVSKHGLLTNLNQYLRNIYLTNLYFTNLRRIQNALIWTQWYLYSPYFETQSAELIQYRHCRTRETIKTRFQVTYYKNIMNYCLYSYLYLIYIWKIYIYIKEIPHIC